MKEEYEGQIEELKFQAMQHKMLLKVIREAADCMRDEIHTVPDTCSSCGIYMGYADLIQFNETFIGFTIGENTWHNQNCDCCPVCVKKDHDWLFEEEESEEVGIVKLTINVIRHGGEPCTQCMEKFDSVMNPKIENKITELAGMEGYTDDVAHAMQYVNEAEFTDFFGGPLRPRILDSVPKSWADKNEWFEIVFA